MIRRRTLTLTLAALVAVGGLVASTSPSAAQATDPPPVPQPERDASPTDLRWADPPGGAHHDGAAVPPAVAAGVTTSAPGAVFATAGGALAATSPGVTLAGLQPLRPVRLLDTRIGLGSQARPVGQGEAIDLQVAGRDGVPAGGVGAVALNITVTEPTAATFVTVWPTGEPRPLASIVNAEPGETVPNLAIVKVGPTGVVSLYNNAGTAHLVADVVGWAPADAFFRPLAPARLLDTRIGLGAPSGPVGPSSVVDLQVTGRAGVPVDGVAAVVLNLTGTEPTAATYVTAYPAGEPLPTASTLNLVAGQTFPNLVVAKVGAGGQVRVYNNAGTTHLVADVMGWVPAGGSYTPVSPARVLDTRLGTGGVLGRVLDGQTISIALEAAPLAPRPDRVPAAATGVILNVTAVDPTAPTFVTVFPAGTTLPLASNVNADVGQTVPNLVFVPLSGDGRVSLFNNLGSVHLVADLLGYVLPRNPADDLDQFAGAQVHVLDVVPADVGGAAGLDVAIAHELTNIDTWLSGQSGGHRVRWDTFGGTAEVTVHRVGLTTSQLYDAGRTFSFGSRIGIAGMQLLEAQLAADGFTDPDKIYLVYLEGVDSDDICGVVLGEATADLRLVGLIGAPRYAHQFVASTCDDPSTTSTPGGSEAANVALHELFHALGAVPTCAPHSDGGAHVDEVPGPGSDLMVSVVVDQPTLDPGRDDYWGHADPSCPDLSDSPYLPRP